VINLLKQRNKRREEENKKIKLKKQKDLKIPKKRK